MDGLIKLMNSNYTGPVNLGNPTEHKIEGKKNISKKDKTYSKFEKSNFTEFATLIKEEIGSDSAIEHKEAVEDDPRRRRPDISLAKKVLDWEPRVSLKQGLAKTIDYFRKELSRKHYSDGNDVHPNEYQVDLV